MFKNYKRNLLVTVVGVFLMLLAFPTMVSADAAITSFSVNRTSVSQGQTVTFSLRTTPEVNYVFADVNGVRVQGTLQSADTWQLIVTPNSTQNVTVVASATNSVTNAAMINIPITVVGVSGPPITAPPITGPPITGPPITSPPIAPPITGPPITMGNLAIHDISETTAIRAGYIQLTVVTGVGANEVWAQFDNNRFRRAQEQTNLRTDTTRTWQINFRPDRWVSQTVQISANREYVFAGATTQNYVLTLTAPFVPPISPAIQSVTPSPRTVVPGGSITFTIRTNLDVNYVWIVDVDGNRRNASPSGSASATGRNWAVTFTPGRTGAVRVYANATNSATGAATRTEQITVQQHNVAILSPTTARWTDDWWADSWRGVVVEVTTNQFAEHVWVTLPSGNNHSLSRVSGSGTSNRTWRVEITNVGNISTLQVHASDVTNSWTARDSRSVSITGQHQGGSTAWVDMQSGSWVANVHINANGVMTFRTNQSHGDWGNWGTIWVDIAGFASVLASSVNGVDWVANFPSGLTSSWQNASVSFTDNTATHRGTIFGTLRWH